MLIVAALGMGTARAQQMIDGWERKATGTSTNLRDICCMDASTLIVCGDNGVILKSADAGETWNQKHIEEGYKLLRMEMADNNTGFCLGVNNLRNKSLLKTIDGGETWTRVSSLPATQGYYYDENDFRLFPVDADTLYLWEPSRLLKSTDGGLSFIQIEILDPSSNVPKCRGMYFEDNIGFVLCGDYEKDGFTLSKTADYGRTWTIVYTQNDYSQESLILPVFKDKSNARVFAEYPTGILETDDGFENISAIHPSEYYYNFMGCNLMEYDMAFTSDNMGCYFSCTILMKGYDFYHAFITNDQGNSWVYQKDNGLDPEKKLFAVDGVDTTFYLASEHGVVYKRGKIIIQDTDEGYSQKVAIQPNPATGQVTVSGEGIQQVEIHNLLGQRVATVEGHAAESLTISLEGLPQGVYLVSVQLADGKRHEKKLIVR